MAFSKGFQAVTPRQTLLVLFGILLLDLIAFTTILPLFPVLMDFYAKQPESRLFHATASVLKTFKSAIGVPDAPRYNSVFFGGLLGSLYSFLQFLACPIAGIAADRFGRKPMLILSALGSLASYALWYASRSFDVFLISRVIGGLSKTSVSVSTTIATDVSEKSQRSKGVVVIGLAFSVAFLIGPMFGAYFAIQGRKEDSSSDFYKTPASFAMLLTVLELVSILVFLPETWRGESSDEKTKKVSSLFQLGFDRIKSISTNVSVLGQLSRLGRTYFLHVFLYSGLEFVLTFLTHLRYEYTSMQQGKMFLLIGGVMILVQGGVTRRVKPEKQRDLAIVGLLMAAVAFVLIGMTSSITVFYVGITLHACASGIVVPSLTTLASCYGNESNSGQLMGVFRSRGYLARALGPFSAAAIFWLLGPELCFVLGGLAIVVPALMLLGVEKRATVAQE